MKLKEELATPLRTMQEIARRIATVSKESKLPINEDEYVASFKVELMDAVISWCRGAKFMDLTKASASRVCVCGNKVLIGRHFLLHKGNGRL